MNRNEGILFNNLIRFALYLYFLSFSVGFKYCTKYVNSRLNITRVTVCIMALCRLLSFLCKDTRFHHTVWLDFEKKTYTNIYIYNSVASIEIAEKSRILAVVGKIFNTNCDIMNVPACHKNHSMKWVIISLLRPDTTSLMV